MAKRGGSGTAAPGPRFPSPSHRRSSPSRSRRRWSARSSSTPCPSSCRGHCPTCATGSSPCTAGSCTPCTSRTCGPTGPTPSAPRPWARSWGTSIPTATPPSTTRWPAWPRTSACATSSSTATATSGARPRGGPGRHALHRVPPGAVGHGDAGRHRRGDHRLRPQLRRFHRRARGAPVALSQPSCQRLPGHRGGDGHQHPAAQPGRGHRRRRPRAREPRVHSRRPHAIRERPRLPDRSADPRPSRHPRRVPDRQGLHQDARQRRGGREPRHHAHRSDRHPVPDLDRSHRAEDRRAGQRRTARRHLRRPERLGGEDAPSGRDPEA